MLAGFYFQAQPRSFLFILPGERPKGKTPARCAGGRVLMLP
jgi:hypothetical protein